MDLKLLMKVPKFIGNSFRPVIVLMRSVSDTEIVLKHTFSLYNAQASFCDKALLYTLISSSEPFQYCVP